MAADRCWQLFRWPALFIVMALFSHRRPCDALDTSLVVQDDRVGDECVMLQVNLQNKSRGHFPGRPNLIPPQPIPPPQASVNVQSQSKAHAEIGNSLGQPNLRPPAPAPSVQTIHAPKEEEFVELRPGVRAGKGSSSKAKAPAPVPAHYNKPAPPAFSDLIPQSKAFNHSRALAKNISTALTNSSKAFKMGGSLNQSARVERAAMATPAPPPYGAAVTNTTTGPPMNKTKKLTKKMNATRLMAANNCEVSSWSDWGICTGSSNGNIETKVTYRTRVIVTPPNYTAGGKPCPVLNQEMQCPIAHIGSGHDTGYAPP